MALKPVVREFSTAPEPAAGFHAAEQADIQLLTRLKILLQNYRAWLTTGRIRLVFGFRQTAELLKPRVKGVVLVHFGTSNWNSILSRQDKRKPASGGQAVIRVGHQIEFFLCHKLYRAGSLTSTYRVVRKYNFKS